MTDVSNKSELKNSPSGNSDLTKAMKHISSQIPPKQSSKSQTSRRGFGIKNQAPDRLFLENGTIIDGRYRIEKRLGEGAMGAVYEVTHLRLQKRFAMKIILPNLANQDEFVARFNREANALSLLNHPNCVNVSDFGQTITGTLYLVMEFLEGKMLSEIASQKSILLADAFEVTRQILMGLGHAHEAGVIHRDIKLDNVLLLDTEDDRIQIKILDFGMATGDFLSEDIEEITQTGIVMGTPQYMAPETFSDQTINEQTDLYAVGVTLFRLLVDRPVFSGNSIAQVLISKRKQPPPDINTFSHIQYPQSLSSFLKKALSSPEQRFSSAMEMLESLNEVTRSISGFSRIRDSITKTAIASTASSVVRPISFWTNLILVAVKKWWADSSTTGNAETPSRAIDVWSSLAKTLVTTSYGRIVFGLMLFPILLAILVAMGFSIYKDAPISDSLETTNQIANHNADQTSLPTSSTEPTEEIMSFVTEENEESSDDGFSEDDVLVTAKRLLDQNKCKRAKQFISEKYPNEFSASAHYLMGCAHMCTGSPIEGLSSYKAALNMNDRYLADTKILEDARDLLRKPSTRFEALDFLATSLGKYALPTIIELAEQSPNKELRHKALEHVKEMDALSHVNQARGLEMDLNQTSKCKEMKEIVEKLAALRTPEAQNVLRRARDSATKKRFHKPVFRFACVRPQILSHLNDIRREKKKEDILAKQ